MKVPCHCTRPRYHQPSRPSPSAARPTPPPPTTACIYIMLALWIHHQTERKPTPQGKARRRHPQDQHHGTGPPTRATPRGQPRQENQAKPRAQRNPDPKLARPHLPLYGSSMIPGYNLNIYPDDDDSIINLLDKSMSSIITKNYTFYMSDTNYMNKSCAFFQLLGKQI